MNKPIIFNVIGDSHGLVFEHSKRQDMIFNVEWVGGATARGSINPNNSTNSLNTFKQFIDQNTSDKLIIMLGEVDCGYLIWYKYQKEGLDIYEQANEAIDRLLEFVNKYALKYYEAKDIVILGSNPPTIEDNADPKFLAGARSEIKASLKERLSLTRYYNRKLKDKCMEHGYHYLDILEKVVNEEGIVFEKWRHHDKHNHHLNHHTISLWLSVIEKMIYKQ